LAKLDFSIAVRALHTRIGEQSRSHKGHEAVWADQVALIDHQFFALAVATLLPVIVLVEVVNVVISHTVIIDWRLPLRA
jgi:hypothetical protein